MLNWLEAHWIPIVIIAVFVAGYFVWEKCLKKPPDDKGKIKGKP